MGYYLVNILISYFSNMQILITLLILLFSAIVHEVAHGLMAEKLGDDTAREEGRITLNPIVHIDPFGSILLPLMLLVLHSPVIFGAAKPVPVNFSNLKPRKWGMILVSLAGPVSNFCLAIIFAVIIKLHLTNVYSYDILMYGILINLVLGVFNLVPIPPLDGSKILAAVLPEKLLYYFFQFERYGFVLLFLFLYIGVLDWIYSPVLGFFWNTFHLSIFDLNRILTSGLFS